MSEYTDSVENGLKGLHAVSFGTCGGCEECRAQHPDFVPFDDWSVESSVEEREWWMFTAQGTDPAVYYRTEEEAEGAARALFAAEVSRGEISEEGGFSSSSCGICGTNLAGDRFIGHALDENGELMHFDDGCVDCVLYISNGDEPEEWRRFP